MRQVKTNHLPLWALSASIVVGGGGLAAIGLFILLGPPGWIDCGWPPLGDALWNMVLSILFFIQHSTMIRPGVRAYLNRWVPEDYVKVLYSVTSGIVLLAVVLLWQSADDSIVELNGVGRWFARLFTIAALAGFLWTGKSLQDFDPLGTSAMLARMGKVRPRPMPMTIQGPYRWVRHPFYFFAIVMIWSNPTLTVDRLMFNVTWTAWIWIGAVLEEQDLLAEYGQVYEDYRQNVPRLLPFKWR